MRIDIWYDSVYTETKICIEGNWQKNDDIFGFLYPVLHYPLQTWLYESGSWSGLYRHILELSRGEKVSLIFHGRESDYKDLQNALKDKAEIELIYKEWKTTFIYEKYIEELKNSIEADVKKIPDGMKELQKEILQMLDSLKEDGEWHLDIYSKEELMDGIVSELPCVFIHESQKWEELASYDSLFEIERLTKSLKRPADAIMCVIQNDNARKEIASIAALYRQMQFCFVGPEDKNTADRMYSRYGYPYILRKKIKRIADMLRMMEDMTADYQETKKRIQDLIYIQQEKGNLSKGEKEELDRVRQKKTWIEIIERSMEKRKKILCTHAVNIAEKGEDFNEL